MSFQANTLTTRTITKTINQPMTAPADISSEDIDASNCLRKNQPMTAAIREATTPTARTTGISGMVTAGNP